MAEVTVRTNGPYVIMAEGLTLVDQDGNAIPLGEGGKVALCRCGQSTNKPFCDGSHKSAGFKHQPTT